MTRRVVLNEVSYFGYGSRSVLKEEIDKRGFNNILIVTDDVLLKIGLVDKVLKILDDIDIKYEVFSSIKPNPTVKNVQDGVNFFNRYNFDSIIAVGGGSVIDTAKAISIIIANPEFYDVVSLSGLSNTKNKGIPLIALPTTAGTAAEVTINYVITDEENDIKMVCVDPNDIPILSIVDSELMSDMPKEISSSTGMDALTHAIEGLITKASWQMSDMFHLQAIKLIFENLEKAVNDNDIESIENMALAQYIAGMGFSNVGLGIVHSMAHQLGAVYDIPHGIANAVLLPYVMEFNGEVSYKKYEELGKVIGMDMDALTKEEIINSVVIKVKELGKKVGINKSLEDLGVRKEDLRMLSKKALIDPCTPGNPRDVLVEDILKLYKKAF